MMGNSAHLWPIILDHQDSSWKFAQKLQEEMLFQSVRNVMFCCGINFNGQWQLSGGQTSQYDLIEFPGIKKNTLNTKDSPISERWRVWLHLKEWLIFL
jgi:hypothetical protein